MKLKTINCFKTLELAALLLTCGAPKASAEDAAKGQTNPPAQLDKTSQEFLGKIQQLIDHHNLQDVFFVENLFGVNLNITPFGEGNNTHVVFYVKDETGKSPINQYMIWVDRLFDTSVFRNIDARIYINIPNDVCIPYGTFDELLKEKPTIHPSLSATGIFNYDAIEVDSNHKLLVSVSTSPAGKTVGCGAGIELEEDKLSQK